jgi:hypothetical protein
MFYKFQDSKWYAGLMIWLPSGTILSVDNKVSEDGWEWHDVAPDGYVDETIKEDEE